MKTYKKGTLFFVLCSFIALSILKCSGDEINSDRISIVSVFTEIQIGELIDKITILQIKSDNIKDVEKLKNIQRELDTLLATYENEVPKSLELNKLWNELFHVNKKLWIIEDDIRKKERKQQFDEEFIKLARSVYYINDERCRIKRKINFLTGSRLIEEKSYTDYIVSEISF